ncbi:SDR family oxidoreductase [Rhodococcus koreensis]
MGQLDGRRVVLTGAGSGIGRAVARRYVAEGARVVALDIDDRVHGLAEECGDAVRTRVANVRDWSANVEAVQTAVDEWGGLDAFVANAGIYDGARALAEIDGADLPAAFAEIQAVNVLAPILGARAALKELIRSRGTVIVTGSFASRNTAGGGVLYTASKHAVRGVIRQLAYEFAPDVRVNGVAPGVAPTTLKGVTALGQEPASSVLDGAERMLPLGHVPAVEEFAGVFTLLASAEASAMTGTLIDVDSGLRVRGLTRPGGRIA